MAIEDYYSKTSTLNFDPGTAGLCNTKATQGKRLLAIEMYLAEFGSTVLVLGEYDDWQEFTDSQTSLLVPHSCHLLLPYIFCLKLFSEYLPDDPLIFIKEYYYWEDLDKKYGSWKLRKLLFAPKYCLRGTRFEPLSTYVEAHRLKLHKVGRST